MLLLNAREEIGTESMREGSRLFTQRVAAALTPFHV
jgi:hypothetical protein